MAKMCKQATADSSCAALDFCRRIRCHRCASIRATNRSVADNARVSPPRAHLGVPERNRLTRSLSGKESGQLEAWVYPLKILRNFRLVFHTEGQTLSAESLARTVITRPKSTTIFYASDTCSVRETFFVPIGEPGTVISLDTYTSDPMEVKARFECDFQSEGPAVLSDPDAE